MNLLGTSFVRRLSLRRLLLNPVAMKELRGRMRGRRAFVVLTVYLAVMSAFIALIYLAFAAAASNPFGPGPQEAGKAVMGAVVGVQVFLVLFIGPAFTAGAISSEKERQTYDLLRTTLLSAESVVAGKLVSALSYVLLLVFASLPLQSIAFLLGGISLSEVLISQLVIVVSALAFALIGLYASSALRSTLAASVVTYAGSVLLTIGLPFIALLFLILQQALFSGPTLASSWWAEAMFAYLLLFLASLNLPATLVVSEVFLIEQSTLWGFTETIRGHSVFIFSPWYANLALFGILALILYQLTVRRVRRIPTR